MANISVADVLSLPSMAHASVLAGGAGLDRLVRSVNIMEVPDVEAFVRTGDLLLTTTYPVHHDPSLLERLVRIFDGRNLAALAIKLGRYLDAVPAGLIQLCDELSFPLISLGAEQSFDEIIADVMSVVLTEYEPEQGRADAIRERLTAVALGGGGLSEITRTLADAIGSRVAIWDLRGAEIAAAGPDIEVDRPEEFDITVSGRVHATMQIAARSSLTLTQRRLARQASFAAGMYIAQTQATALMDERLRNITLEELVRGTPTTHDAAVFNWPLHRLLQVAVAAPVTRAEEGAIKEMWGSAALSWQRGRECLVLFDPAQARDTAQAARDWAEELTRTEPGVHVGVGRRAKDRRGLPLAHTTALTALSIGRRTGQLAARHEDLEMELLLASLDPDAAARFIEAQIGELVDYDLRHGTDLVRTLREFLGAESRVAAAERLFVHYNTLKYRLELIRDLLGADWSTSSRKTALLMALELHRLR